ncbi:HSF-type DNA-binding domain-containing protein [Ditylenchus destructor]|nr:HSF-type DNA-binding domain-containing protein [Ditylenchus destructor]
MKEKKGGIFLSKLWSILQDESISHIVCWDPSGVSFHILNLHKFCEEVLSQFFKHKNMSSFVRQLNQYGFRKILSVDPSFDNNNNSAERMQYCHSLFCREHPELLSEIKRQPQSEPNRISEAINWFRQNNSQLQNKVYDLTCEKELLCNEVRLLREQHLKQQQNMERVVQILMSQYQLPFGQQYGPGNQAESGSLAAHSLSHQNHNLDILLGIEQNIRSETVRYSSNSAFSLPVLQKMEEDPLMEEYVDTQKCMRPEIIQFTNNHGFNLDQNGSNLEACSSSASILSSIINHEQSRQELQPSDGHGVNWAIAKEEI